MSDQNLKRIFDRAYEYPAGKNFMTPDIYGYYAAGPFVAELSSGDGMGPDAETMWGVTVVYQDAQGRSHRQPTLSQLFQGGEARKEARHYIDHILPVLLPVAHNND